MRTKKTVLYALLCALALVIGYFENLIPAFFVVPGGKIGLANVVTMAVFFLFRPAEALAFGALRSFLSAVLYNGFFAFFYSLVGTFFSVISMAAARKALHKRVSEIGLSIIGAAFYNFGQLALCAAVLESVQVFRYFPALLMLSAFAGAVTGFLAHHINAYLHLNKPNKE